MASGPGGASPHLRDFLKKLTPGARILELGYGSGRDAEAMIKAGFDVEPTDGTPEIALKAEEHLARKVRVWAAASLLHVPLGVGHKFARRIADKI